MPHRSKNLHALTRLSAALAVTGLAFALTACGGGSENSTPYTLAGTISSLTVDGLVLSNGSSTLSVGASASNFQFTDSQTGSYDVKVSAQPDGETCSVSNGSGSGGNNVTNVAVTCRPYAVFVADNSGNSLTQFAIGSDGTLTANSTLTLPYAPSSLVVSSDGAHGWVSYSNNKLITNLAINSSGVPSKQSTTTDSATAGYGLAVSPGDDNLYSADYGGATVSQFSINSSGIASALGTATVASGNNPSAVAVTPDGTHVYVANTSGNSISCYSVGSDGALSPLSTASVSTGTSSAPQALTVNAAGTYLYVTLSGTNKVVAYAINSSTGALTSHATASTGTTPNGVVVSPSGAYAYVANSSSGTISQYTLAGGGLSSLSTATIAAGTQPLALSISPDGHYLYAANYGDNTVSQYAIGSGGLLAALTPATIAAGAAGPFSIVVR